MDCMELKKFMELIECIEYTIWNTNITQKHT